MLTLISLSFWGCEWKPPRRPAVEALKVISEDKTETPTEEISFEDVETNLSTGVQSENTSDASLPEPERQPQVERADITPDQTQSSGDDTKRDYLLKIDPHGPPLIHVKKFVIAKDVKRRRPRGVSKTFSSDSKQVMVFLSVRNFETPQKIQLKWMYQGQVMQRDRLRIGISPRWRTWSFLQLSRHKRRLGEWRVEVETVQGQKLLGVTHFTVKAAHKARR